MKFRMTIGRKLAGLSLVALAFLLAVGAAGYLAIDYLNGTTERMRMAQDALRYSMEIDQAHDALRGDALAAMVSAREIDQDEVKAVRKDLHDHGDEFLKALQQLDLLGLDPAARAAVAKARPTLESFVTQANAMVELAFKDRIGAQAQLPTFLATYKQLDTELEALSRLIEARANAMQAESKAAAQRSTIGIVIAIALAFFVLLLVSTLTARNIVRRIAAALRVAETVATGDLSSRIEARGNDEAGQLLAALAQMNTSLVRLVSTVRQSSESIASGTGQIAIGNQDLSQRTEEQASNLQQTAASMEQISATVRSNADSTQQARSMAAEVSASAGSSGEAVAQLVATMAQITEASRRITDIIGVIDGIAFQTNILALNAAVEAARAGEQGRGFAVVAAEVRTLAQRSASAAKEIKGLIEASVDKVAAGERQAATAGQRMGDVVRQVDKMQRVIAEISDVTQEQTKGIAEVSLAVTQIDHVTQSNASLVEESAAAAESLNRQALRLVEAVSLFRLEAQEPRLLPA